MIILFEIFIYVCFAYVMYSLARQSQSVSPDEQVWDQYIVSFIVFFTLISALRFCVGGDYFSYVKIFEKGIVREDREEQELLWNLLVRGTSALGLSSAVGFGICSFAQILFIVKACKDCKYVLIALPIVMFGSRYYIDMDGAIRQMTAACFFVWFSKFIVEKKLLKYLLCVLIASLFHHSALVLAVFYFVPNTLVMTNRRALMLCIFLLCFIVGLTPSFGSFVEYVVQLTHMAGYEEYESRVNSFLIYGNEKEVLSFGPMMLSYFLIALIIIWFGPRLEERYSEKIPNFNLWYNLSFLFACCYFLISNTGHIFIRPVQYLEFFQMMIASLLLYDFFIESKELRKAKYIFWAFVFIIWINISWDITKQYAYPYNICTYKTILFRD